MTLSYRDLYIERLTIGNLEELRLLRNESRLYLNNSQLISIEDQKLWYEHKAHKHLYFTAFSNNSLVGFIFAKEFDLIQKSFHTGIFFKHEFKNTSLPALVSILLTYFLFLRLNFNKAISTVHKSNTSALTFNEKLGFIKVDENDIFLKFELHKSNFLLKFSSIVLHIEKELKCNLDISELDNFKINQFSDEGNSKKL